jgi:hypothetical protein
MFSCPRCSDRFEGGAVPSALICPRCRDNDGVFSPLTFWLFDPPVVRAKRAGATKSGGGEAKAASSRDGQSG